MVFIMNAVSIIIPTLNEEQYLPQLLGSLYESAHDKQLQIIIVDAKSTDRTLEIVQKWRRNTPTGITLSAVKSEHRNIALQRNLGASTAQHEILLFMDADVRVPSAHAFTELIQKFDQGGYSAASCYVTSIEPDWRAKLFFYIWTQFSRFMQYSSPNVLGACIIPTKTVFNNCKGFDPTITIGEDANYCLRAMKFGRFRILPVLMEVSARRFRKHGYWAMGWEYVKIFIHRSLSGEYRLTRPQRYDFGNFTDV